jgi:hypothetical protein
MRPWDQPDQARWIAVYSAYIASQTAQQFIEGRGAPTEADMRRFVEEASAVADLEAEATVGLSIEFERKQKASAESWKTGRGRST